MRTVAIIEIFDVDDLQDLYNLQINNPNSHFETNKNRISVGEITIK